METVNDSVKVPNMKIPDFGINVDGKADNSKTDKNLMPIDSYGNCPSKYGQNGNSSATKSNLNSALQNKYLMILNLSHANLRTLPRDVKNLKCLVCLDLSHNQLDVLPNSLSDIPQLRYLNISHNNFQTVPYVFQIALQFIRVLDISFNVIMSFDESPCCCFNLEELNISHNKLNQIPNWIFNRTPQLKKLDISSNILKNINDNGFLFNTLPFYVRNLCYLNLENCKLMQDDLFFITHMTGLKTLQIGNISLCFSSRNHFERINIKLLKKCVHLKNFAANNLCLSLLPLDIGSLNQIQSLNLENNFLTWLPDSFCDLTSLEVCRLGYNTLCLLPTEFGKLVNLKKIFLNSNLITELPKSFKSLINLEYCDLYNNKLNSFDSEILKLESMKGIDLECNNLNFQKICTSQEECEEFYVKYKNLKEQYRKGLNDERINLQTEKEDDSQTEKFKRDEGSNSSSDDYLNDDIPPVQEYPNPEYWDTECAKPCLFDNIDPDSDDDFDPKVNYEEELKKKCMKYGNNYVGNFCPSESHVTSLRKYFLHKPDYDPIKDQYDSN